MYTLCHACEVTKNGNENTEKALSVFTNTIKMPIMKEKHSVSQSIL